MTRSLKSIEAAAAAERASNKDAWRLGWQLVAAAQLKLTFLSLIPAITSILSSRVAPAGMFITCVTSVIDGK